MIVSRRSCIVDRKTNHESGYALIAVLGALTVMLILITGILPSVAQEVKRERETEMLFRGRQMVDAIARYRVLLSRAGQVVGQVPGQIPGQPRGQVTPGGVVGFGWPQSLEQLADGINLRGSTRRVRLLRPSALKDPMNHDAPWRPVGFNDPALREFLEAYFETMGQSLSVWPPQFRNQYLAVTIEFGNQDEEKRDRQDKTKPRSAFGGVFSEGDENERPNYIFGVVSESQEQPLRDYYGLERYDQWVFAYIPELQSVPAASDQQVQMLSREVIFPTDPLALTQFGGLGGIRSVGSLPGVRPPQVGPGIRPGVAPTGKGNTENQPRSTTPSPRR